MKQYYVTLLPLTFLGAECRDTRSTTHPFGDVGSLSGVTMSTSCHDDRDQHQQTLSLLNLYTAVTYQLAGRYRDGQRSKQEVIETVFEITKGGIIYSSQTKDRTRVKSERERERGRKKKEPKQDKGGRKKRSGKESRDY